MGAREIIESLDKRAARLYEAQKVPATTASPGLAILWAVWHRVGGFRATRYHVSVMCCICTVLCPLRKGGGGVGPYTQWQTGTITAACLRAGGRGWCGATTSLVMGIAQMLVHDLGSPPPPSENSPPVWQHRPADLLHLYDAPLTPPPPPHAPAQAPPSWGLLNTS